MRELTLLLVLANLTFMAWAYWIAPEETPAPVAQMAASDVPRIVLASERRATAARGDTGRAARARGASSSGDAATVPESAVMPGEATGIRAKAGASADAGAAREPGEEDAPRGGSARVNAGIVTQDVPVDARPGAAMKEGSPAPGLDAGGSSRVNAAATSPTGSSTGRSGSAVAVAAPSPHCVSIGPYLDLAESAEAAARLREQGYVPSQRLADSPLWVGNWVYLPPFRTRDEAVAAAEKLRANGVEDLYVESGGDDENAVSLGLFSDRERAESLAKKIRSFGYAPQISDKYRVASAYWVDVVLPPDASLSPAKYQVRPGRIVRAEEQQCPPGTRVPVRK